MKVIFFEEAKKNRVFPVHGIFDGAVGRPVLNAGRTTFTYTSPIARIPENGAPITKGRSFDIIADIIVPEAGAKGVLATQGGRFGGYAFYLADGVPTFRYNMTGDMQYIVRGSGPVSPGKHVLKAQFDIDKPEPGAPGTMTLFVDARRSVKDESNTHIAPGGPILKVSMSGRTP